MRDDRRRASAKHGAVIALNGGARAPFDAALRPVWQIFVGSLPLSVDRPRAPANAGSSVSMSIGDPATIKIVGAHLNRHLVSDHGPDSVLLHAPGRVRQDFVIVLEANAKAALGK